MSVKKEVNQEIHYSDIMILRPNRAVDFPKGITISNAQGTGSTGERGELRWDFTGKSACLYLCVGKSKWVTFRGEL